ncbi:alpha/beta hydrolase [Bremerella cremea]|uniref:Alpha/beta hydrolase n=1 Tax=Bremerella cremea TaxID=1031537 RepID=A0A368KYC1_9BACT|nr:alpha/beta hydrolase [Bremerella cremea]RCS54815.1 alpha/beta hydrolase [Bremerella cremea]
MKRILFPLFLLFALQQVSAAELTPQKNIAYGTHPRQVLDFYPAKSDKPTPVVFHIHGGGWQSGDKKTNPKQFLDHGISVVSINYRYVKNGVADGISPPVKAPLEDAARALQFVRSKAGEWNLDKQKIGATGGSAGACSSLWLAFHDDMAEPDSDDPIARESTRLYCAAVNGAQVTLDPKPLREWMPNYRYGAHAFGLPGLDAVLEKREEILPWIEEYSPMSHVSKDDPPIFMFYRGEVPVVGSSPKDPTHSGIMGVKLAEKLEEVGVEVDLTHPGIEEPKYKSSTEYLIEHLKN